MSNQLQITGGAKVRNLEGVLTGTSGVVSSLGINVPSGIPQLDGSGKILVSQLPNSVMEYKGTWDASTNTPTLANGTGNQGDVYLCSAAGTVNFGAGPITFAVGDQVIYSGTIWQKASGATGTVTSVAVTSTGNDAISITGSPITTAGSINIGFTGTSAQYVNGAGDLTTFPSLTGYVPYTGATTDVDLGVYVLNAQALHVKGTAGAGHLGLKHQSAAATGSANESLIYANVDGDLAWQNDNLYLTTLSTHANTANRVYTFPDLTGTLALTSDLSSYVPYTGATGNVNLGSNNLTASNLFGETSLNVKILASGSAYSTGYSTFSTLAGKLTLAQEATAGNLKAFTFDFSAWATNSSYTYTLPAANGTIALTSNLSSYVPYTGATADVNLGTTYSLSANNITAAGVVKSDFGLQLKSGLTTTISGYLSISAQKISTNSQLNVYTDTGFYFSLIAPNTANYSYTFPATSGTIALLEGTQTFTGSKTFSVSVNNDDGLKIKLGSASNLTAGYLTLSAYGETTPLPDRTILRIGTAATQMSLFKLQNTGSYTYDFPASSGTLVLGTGTTNYLPKFTGASTIGDSLIYDNGTGVGIGTTTINASTKLAISAPNTITDARGILSVNSNNAYGADLGGSISLGGENGSGSTPYPFGKISGRKEGAGAAYSGYLSFATTFSDGTITERMRITSAGYLKASNAGTYLGSTGAYHELRQSAQSTASVVVSASNASFDNNVIAIGSTRTASSSFNLIAAYANDFNDLKFVVRGDGNVGIGTSSPATRFDLAGTIGNFQIAASGAEVFLTRNDNNDILATGGTSSGITIGAQSYVRFSVGTSYTERMRITSGGKLCVGSTSTIFSSSGNNITAAVSAGGEAVLEVSNNSSSDSSPAINCFKTSTTTSSAARFIQFYSQNGSIAMGGIVGNGSTNVQFASISDIREKENITTINGSLDKILALNPVEYDWIKTKEHIKAGFVAQEVEQIFPEYVVENMSNDGEEERKGLTGGMSSGIIAHLVKAIQEQQEQIEELKALINK